MTLHFFVESLAGLAGDCWQNSGLILVCQCLQWVERWRWHLRLKRVQFSFHAMANIWWAQIHPHERLRARESYKEPNSKITIGIVCTSKQCREKASRANSQPANWTRKIHHAIHVVRNEIESREGKKTARLVSECVNILPRPFVTDPVKCFKVQINFSQEN